MSLKMKKGLIIAGQLGVLIAVYEFGCAISSMLPIDLPGNIIGMGLLLTCLVTGILKRKHVGMACDYLIDNMSIFFVPAGVGIMGCVSLLQGAAALKFAFVCIVTTVLVFLSTSATVVLVQRLMEKRAASATKELAR
jgi:holin-like protein